MLPGLLEQLKAQGCRFAALDSNGDLVNQPKPGGASRARPTKAGHVPEMEHAPPRKTSLGKPRPSGDPAICSFDGTWPYPPHWHRRCFKPSESLCVVVSTPAPKDPPMFDTNANLLFFAYVVIVAGLCPICERLANHFSR